jgi:hypothetical protein
MATEIITNINSVLEQAGKRQSVNYIQSTFNPAFYQFALVSPLDLFIGDTIYFIEASSVLQGVIIDIDGLNVTIDNIPFGVYLPANFTALTIFPPRTQTNNFDVRVVAAFNPIVIEMQRQDFKDNSFRSTWNNTYVAIDGGAQIDEFTVGETIELSSTGGYIGTFTILNVSGTEVTFNKTWNSFNPYFLAIINFPNRINFYVTLRISVDPAETIYRDLRFTPDSKGIIRAEISGALRSLLNLNYTEDLTFPIRAEETNLSSSFYFATKDNWINSGESWIQYYAAEDVKYCIAGAFQIGDPNNGYYNKYFANTDGSFHYPDYMPQWITQFEQPSLFANFPFTLSFLGNLTLDPANKFELRYQIVKANGIYYNGIVDDFNFTDFVSLTRLDITKVLQVPYSAGVINDAKTIELRFGLFDRGYFFDCLAPITFNVKRPIEQSCNTFYVRWLNTLGGWDYWLFEGKIYEGFKVENGNNYESYFDNISGISDFENVTFKNVTPAVQVGSNTLTKNEAEGLKILPTSPKIYWYNEELSKWIGVIVEPGSFNVRSTKDDYFNVELTFVKPRFFNQFA